MRGGVIKVASTITGRDMVVCEVLGAVFVGDVIPFLSHNFWNRKVIEIFKKTKNI